MREQQHVADARAVGGEHHQAIYADPFARRRRQAVFERADVVGVVVHGFLVAARLGFRLLLEARVLVFRIVQLGESVGDLAPGDVELEALDDFGIAVAAPREGRHFGGVVHDEGRLDELLLGGRFEQGELQRADAGVRVRLDAALFQRGDERFAAAELALAGLRMELADRLEDAELLERPGEVHRVSAVAYLQGPEHFPGDLAQKLLRESHEVAVIAVSLVELEHGELGVVPGRDALVPEIAVDLEHFLESAYHQAFQVELGRDAQEKLHVERVVVRLERPGVRAAGNRLHHRRLDLEETLARHELADRLHDAAAGLEDRKSTRLNSSHMSISYAVFCLKKKKKKNIIIFYKKKKKLDISI